MGMRVVLASLFLYGTVTSPCLTLSFDCTPSLCSHCVLTMTSPCLCLKLLCPQSDVVLLLRPVAQESDSPRKRPPGIELSCTLCCLCVCCHLRYAAHSDTLSHTADAHYVALGIALTLQHSNNSSYCAWLSSCSHQVGPSRSVQILPQAAADWLPVVPRVPGAGVYGVSSEGSEQASRGQHWSNHDAGVLRTEYLIVSDCVWPIFWGSIVSGALVWCVARGGGDTLLNLWLRFSIMPCVSHRRDTSFQLPLYLSCLSCSLSCSLFAELCGRWVRWVT